MQGVQTRAASITHDVIQEHLDAKLLTPDEYADLNTKFNSFYSSAAKPYATAMYQQRKMLAKLLQDPEYIHTRGEKEINVARTVPAYNELTEVMSDTTQQLMESGINFGSKEFLDSWNKIVSEQVQLIGAKDEYRPRKPKKIKEKKRTRKGLLSAIIGLFDDDEEGE